MSIEKRYLGDGVYAASDGYHIILTTEDGIRVQNTIFLEPPVLAALNRYYEDVYRENARRADEANQSQEG